MHIPDKYRDRYDRLALSHPWMREMRDEPTKGIDPESIRDIIKRHFGKVAVIDDGGETVEWRDGWTCNVGFDFKAIVEEINTLLPTNRIDGETNGIHVDAQLVAPVEIMRKASGELHAVDYARLTLEATDTSDMFAKLADMVERDYVRRDDYDFTVEMLNCMKTERDEWKAKAEGYADALEKLGCSVLANGTVFGPDSGKSAKRAAAVERLRKMQHVDDYGDWIEAIAEVVRGTDKSNIGDYGMWESLIEILTDDDGLRSNDGAVAEHVTNLEWLFEHDREKLIAMASESCDCATCVYGWPERDSWQCADERYTVHCTEGNREWLMTPHANDDSAPENDVNAKDVDANDANATCNNSGENVTHDSEALDYYSDRYAEMDAEIAELTAKVDEQSELIAARGKTIEALERFMSERKLKLKKQLENKTEQCRKLKAERDEYRELYEAAMSTDYAQVARERDEMSGQIEQIRSIIDETTHDGQSDD